VAHAKLYRTLFHQTLRNEHIRLPDLTVYLPTEPDVLERGARSGRRKGRLCATISLAYLREIHDSYESAAANWRRTLLGYQEHRHRAARRGPHHAAAEIDMMEHPDYVHVAAGTIREKVRRMIAARRSGTVGPPRRNGARRL